MTERDGSRREAKPPDNSTEHELMESAVLRDTRQVVEGERVQALRVGDLTEADLTRISWSGGPSHPKYVAEALQRRSQGEADYLAVRAPNGWPVSIGGIAYRGKEGDGTLWQLATHPKLRGLGIGSRLIAEAENRIKMRGLEWARLGVEDDNRRARALYERLSYEVCGREQQSWDQVDEKGEVRTYHAEVTLMKKHLAD